MFLKMNPKSIDTIVIPLMCSYLPLATKVSVVPFQKFPVMWCGPKLVCIIIIDTSKMCGATWEQCTGSTEV